MKTNLQIAQEFAMGQCLSNYRNDLTYQEICELLNDDELNNDENDCPIVTVWEPFEYLDVEHIMDNMVSAVERLLDKYRTEK
jgi:hypothetical protein